MAAIETYTMTLDGPRLDTALAVIGTISDDADIRTSADGWYIRAVSPAMERMAIVRMTVPDCPDATFAVDVPKMRKALSLCGEHPTVTVGDGSVLVQGDGYRMRLPSRLYEAKGKDKSLDYPAMFVTKVSSMSRFMSSVDPKAFCETKVVITPDRVVLDSTDDTGMGPSMDPVRDAQVVLTSGETEEARFSTSGWQDILKVLPKDAEISVSMGTDYPAEISFGDGPLSVRWMIAPRIYE